MITGAVLAGGKSIRFGTNKVLHSYGGKRLLDWATDSLRPFCDRIMVVANNLAPYMEMRVMLAMDVIPHQGPLGGIYTALLFSPAEWVLVKAADMPFLVPQLASLILEEKEGFDAVVPKLNDNFNPLVALYHRRCLPAIARRLSAPNGRRVVGFYREIRLKTIAEETWRKVDPAALSFKNVNTPSDLAELDGLERS
jgi:molybdopterin-guanine dinucleotide biosynthesis protein A